MKQANPISSWLAELTAGDSSYHTLKWSPTRRSANHFAASLELFDNFGAWSKLYLPDMKFSFKQFKH